MVEYRFNGIDVQEIEKKKIPNFLKWLLPLTIISIVTVFGGDMIQELLTPQLTSADIVKNHYIKWESPLMVCDYKDYYNPTVTEYNTVLSSVMDTKSGKVQNLGVEVLQYYNVSRIEQECTDKIVFDSKNNSDVTVQTCKNVTNYYIESKWVNNITKFLPKTLYSIRQCFTRKNILDNFEIDVSVPFMELPLKEFTIITISGLNQSVLMNVSKLDIAVNFNTNISDVTGIHTITSYNNVTTAVKGVYLNGSQYNVSIKKYINITDARVNTFFSCFAWVNVTTLNVAARETIFGMSNNPGLADLWLAERNVGNVFRAYIREGGADYYISSPIIQDNNYHMITLTRNSTNHSLYVDGTYIGNKTATLNTVWRSPMSIGRLGNVDLYYSNISRIDEFACFNKSFSSTEILNINNSGLFYPFNIYGVYNSSTPFNLLKTISDCDNTSRLNISLNGLSFTPLNNGWNNTFLPSTNGFYLRIDTKFCSYVFMNATNSTTINNGCGCDNTVNWNPTINCTITADCDIRPYNLSCATNNFFNITNGALVRFNTTEWGFNCSSYIKSTGLLSG